MTKHKLADKPIGLFAQITRVDEEQRLVYGIATDETPVREWDDVEVVVAHDATKQAVARWLEWGNIREMHQPSAVGVATEVSFNDETRQTFLTARIVDDPAWEKVRAGVYKGFSIQGPIHTWEQPDAKVKRIVVTNYDLNEISLCDRPKNPMSKITLWQAEGTQQAEGLQQAVEFDEESEVNDVKKSLQRVEPLWLAGGDPYLHVMPIETEWDEASAIAEWLTRSTENERVNWAEYGRMFLLRDAANPGMAESYRLPFAELSEYQYYDDGSKYEALAAIPSALFAAVTALSDMTDLSDTTKRDVEGRIEMYYHSMNRRAPWELQQNAAAQTSTGGDNVEKVLQEMWRNVMGEEAVPEEATKAIELIRAKLTPEPIKIEGAPLEPSPELKRAIDGITSLDAKLTAFEVRLAKIEAMPVMPLVQRTGDPEMSIEEKIAKLERTIKTQKLQPDAPEVIELQRLYQQKRSAKKS
jgi:phage head maturation protease